MGALLEFIFMMRGKLVLAVLLFFMLIVGSKEDQEADDKATKHVDERYGKPVQFVTLIAGLFAAELLTLI